MMATSVLALPVHTGFYDHLGPLPRPQESHKILKGMLHLFIVNGSQGSIFALLVSTTASGVCEAECLCVCCMTALMHVVCCVTEPLIYSIYQMDVSSFAISL